MRRAALAIAPYVAPALLVAIAIQQLILASTAHLTPWKGGGFGMFATVDRSASRIVRVVLIVDGREIPARMADNDALASATVKAGVLPTRARLTALATSLARRTWLVDRSTDIARPAASGLASDDARTIRRPEVRVEIHRIQFDPRTLELRRVFLSEAASEP